MTTMRERLLAIIASEIDARKRFKELEDLSGISAESWKAVWHGRQRATLEMVEAVAQQWPDYAYWLACGDTEPERGHVAPKAFVSTYPIIRGEAQEWATRERQHKLALLKQQPADEEERIKRFSEIENEVFKLREKHIVPAVYVWFEKTMRALGEVAKPEFFLLEYDTALRKIREERHKEESKLQTELQQGRKNLGQSVAVEKLLTKLIPSALRKVNGDKTK